MRKLLLIAALLTSVLSAQDKKRVAVMNFDYGTVSANVAQIFGSKISSRDRGCGSITIRGLATISSQPSSAAMRPSRSDTTRGRGPGKAR